MSFASMALCFHSHNQLPALGNTEKHIAAEAPNKTGTAASKAISEEETGAS